MLHHAAPSLGPSLDPAGRRWAASRSGEEEAGRAQIWPGRG